MQFRDNHSFKKYINKKYINSGLPFMLVILVLILIIRYLYHNQTLIKELSEELTALRHEHRLYILVFPVLLVPVNWMIEAIRWQRLVRRVEVIGLYQAFKAVLASQSLSFITPQGLGDYLGRIWHLGGEQRKEAIGAVLLGRWLQSLVTGLFGLFGIYLVGKHRWQWTNEQTWLYSGTILTIILLFVVLPGYIRSGWFVKFREWLKNSLWFKYFKVISQYGKGEISLFFGLSLIRYLVFSFQFYLIVLVFQIDLSIMLVFGGIAWMFFIKSIIPVLNIFTDLGVREVAVVYYFAPWNSVIPAIVLSSGILWIINLLVPTLIGLMYFHQFKVHRR